MKKVFSVIALCTTAIGYLFAQDTLRADTVQVWRFEGQGSFTFSQVHLDNWAAGGEKSVSGLTVLNFLLSYNKGKSSWENNLDLNFGLIKQDAKPSVKSDDKIELSLKYGLEAKKNLYYTALVNLKTQMLNGYDPSNTDSLISAPFSPAYMNVSLGLDYKYKKKFSLVFAPLSGKITIVSNDSFSDRGLFGVEPGKKIKTELGSLLKTTIKKEIIKNVTFKSKLVLFTEYSEYILQTDMEWESSLNMSINKYLTTNMILHLIYDDDIISEVQLKEIFGLGLTYKF
jgi:hypothetical protein